MSESGHKLRVDFQKCIKAGECYYNHLDLFASTNSGFPALKVRDLDNATHLREAREANEVCPSGAISLG